MEQIEVRNGSDLNMTYENEKRYKVVRYEGMEIHLSDVDAGEENALCGEDTSTIDCTGVDCCLESRLHGHSVGTPKPQLNGGRVALTCVTVSPAIRCMRPFVF